MPKIDIGPISIEISFEEMGILGREIKHLFLVKREISDYFVVKGALPLDIVVYELGLRPRIPLVDLLYLEYLHNLLKNGGITQKIFIFPTVDLSSTEQTPKGLDSFRSNVSKVLQSYANQAEIINPYDKREHTEYLVSRQFFEDIKTIGSRGFLDFIKNQYGIQLNTWADFNRYHPENLRLVSIFTHIIRGTLIFNYMTEQGILKKDVRLGLLIWESEVDKLGMLYRAAQRINIDFVPIPILGKTIFSSRSNALPTFDSEVTLNMFDESPAFIRKLSSKNRRETNEQNHILKTILRDNYGEEINPNDCKEAGKKIFSEVIFVHNKTLKVEQLTNNQYITLCLVYQLRKHYDKQFFSG